MENNSLIDVKNLTRIFLLGENTIKAVDSVTLIIHRGEFVAIMGHSGSGKSTFMNIVGCLDTPTSGSYFLENRDVSKLNRDELADIRNKKIGFVFQGFNLLPRTPAIENVELPMLYNETPAGNRREKALESLRVVGLTDRAHHHPNQLSGGQQQRLAIARAIVNSPSIILADEPTGNLDSRTSDEIMELFVKLNRESNITIILVTHEADIAEYADRHITFRDGQIISDDRKKET
jgi:putative ABC transport system ATP-binding protein